MTHAIALADCPADIRAHFLGNPAYQAAVQITKSESTGVQSPTHVTKPFKIGAQQVKKAVRPPFGEVLRGSMARNAGTAPPAIPTAPAPTTAPTDEILSRATASTRQAHNTPKAPATWPAERGSPVEWRDLQQAIDLAMSKRQDEEKAEAFNRSRSAFSRITPTRKSDVAGGGSGDAWSLRNFGGKLAASVLNATASKGESPLLPNDSAWRPMTGSTLK